MSEIQTQELPQELQEQLGNVELSQEQLVAGQQAYLKNLAETFDEEQLAKYKETLVEYNKYVDEIVASSIECFKACKVVDGATLFDRNHDAAKNMFAIAGTFEFLEAHGKLPKEFLDEFRAVEEKLFLAHLRFNSCVVLRPEQQEEIVAELDQRVMFSVLGLFSFQAEQTLKTLMGIKRESMLDQKDIDLYRGVIDKIKEVKDKLFETFNGIKDYLGFMEIDSSFIELGYKNVLTLIDEFEQEVQNNNVDTE